MRAAVGKKDSLEVVLTRSFGLKSCDQIKDDLAISRAQFARGEYKEAGVVLKGLRAKYGL